MRPAWARRSLACVFAWAGTDAWIRDLKPVCLNVAAVLAILHVGLVRLLVMLDWNLATEPRHAPWPLMTVWGCISRQTIPVIDVIRNNCCLLLLNSFMNPSSENLGNLVLGGGKCKQHPVNKPRCPLSSVKCCFDRCISFLDGTLRC